MSHNEKLKMYIKNEFTQHIIKTGNMYNSKNIQL